MLNKIIDFALKNRLAIVVAALIILCAGLYNVQEMDVDVFPDLNAPTVVVMTEATGMAPEEVERLVTFPIETAVNGATDVRRVRSSSTTGFSVVWVEFDWGTDIYRARQIVSEKLATVSESLPAYAGRPILGPQSSILGEVLIIGLTSDSVTTQEQLRTIADWTIRPRLLSTGGVAQVAVLGGDIREYQIQIDPNRMRTYRVALDDLMNAVRGMNQNASGGVLYEYGNEYIIRGALSTNDLDLLAQVAVPTTDGGTVRLEQVATVAIGSQTPKLGLASVEGKPAVLLTVTKQPNTSTIELTEHLDKAIEELKAQLPQDVVVSTNIFRQKDFIDGSIGNIKKSLWEGALFVILVLFIFLQNGRTTLISLVSIPMSLLITILVMRVFGLNINTMSIGGMAIAIGSLVDDAIVDVENVYKHLRQNALLPREKRLSVREVVYNASREVRLPVINSTFIIVVSFVPLFLLSGMEGRMLAPLGVAFIVSLFASTLVALTLTPVLCSYLLGTEHAMRHADREPRLVQGLRKVYTKALAGALAYKKTVLGVTFSLFVAAAVAFCFFGHSFLPGFNEGSFTINVSTLPGVSLEESDAIGRKAEEILLSVPEIKTVARKTGRAELDEHALGVNTSEIEAPFLLKDRSKEEVMAEIRQKMSVLSGVNLEIGQPISHRIDAMLSGTQSNIAIKVFGTDLNKMYQIGNQIKTAIASVDGVADLNVEQQVERPQLLITPRRDMLARYGISPAEFGEQIDVLLGGSVVSQVYEGSKAFDLVVRLNPAERATMDDIRDICISTATAAVPLSALADVRSAMGPNTINRENVCRKLVVSANVTNGDLRGAVNDIQQIINEQITLPEGYHIEYGGQFESEEKASRTIALAMVGALIVIFLLLFFQFKDMRQAAVVLCNLPLALMGGVLAVALDGSVLSIPALIGFISLFGIATRNGMLLIERYNDLSHEGVALHERIMRGSADRLNPILMTALTTALSLIPLALGGDLPGNEIQSPMAKVILCGLLSSTLLNGFIIPIMYSLVEAKHPHTNDNK